MKIRTLNHLQDRLDDEFAWRLKELDNLKKLVRTHATVAQKTAIRSGICLAYAHWEGFVKRAAEDYIEFVSNQRLRFDQLADCFIVIGAKRHVASLNSDSSAAAAVGAVQFFRNDLADRAYLRLPGHVKTKANLNSEVFENIAVTIGIGTSDFVSRYNQIDEALLARRNRIAHGEYLDLDADPCRNLIDDVINLLRQFKNEIERVSSAEAYRSTGTSP
tara:strand:+ start:142090 stop:142743 length:654 start_codon:yes stop_codon:yes gene_type:complete